MWQFCVTGCSRNQAGIPGRSTAARPGCCAARSAEPDDSNPAGIVAAAATEQFRDAADVFGDGGTAAGGDRRK